MKSLTLTVSAFAMICTTVALCPSGAHAVVGLLPGLCADTECLTSSASEDPMKVSFDENGNFRITVTSGSSAVTVSQGKDPSNPAGGAPVLIYSLPQAVISGTVFFTEPGAASGTFSDALRFTDATGQIGGGVTNGTLMIFYSDVTPGEAPAKADTGIPATGGNFIVRAEVGPETGDNGFDYQPGGVPYPGNNEYVGFSDFAVPEPTTWVMMIMGFACLGFAGYRKAKGRTTLSGT
jgi:hypothetical protein